VTLAYITATTSCRLHIINMRYLLHVEMTKYRRCASLAKYRWWRQCSSLILLLLTQVDKVTLNYNKWRNSTSNQSSFLNCFSFTFLNDDDSQRCNRRSIIDDGDDDCVNDEAVESVQFSAPIYIFIMATVSLQRGTRIPCTSALYWHIAYSGRRPRPF